MRDKKTQSDIIFPNLEEAQNVHEDHEIVQIFLQRFRDMNCTSMSEKIIDSIEKTADITGNTDTYVSKILVLYGLRANRGSFPQAFLDHIEKIITLSDSGLSLSRKSYSELQKFWTKEGRSQNAHLFVPKEIPSLMTV